MCRDPRTTPKSDCAQLRATEPLRNCAHLEEQVGPDAIAVRLEQCEPIVSILVRLHGRWAAVEVHHVLRRAARETRHRVGTTAARVNKRQPPQRINTANYERVNNTNRPTDQPKRHTSMDTSTAPQNNQNATPA